MPAQYDVAIVGGGPAGLATAIEVGRLGFRTVVLDGRQPPIDKACGEGLLPDAIERLRRLGAVIPPGERGIIRGIEFSDDLNRVSAPFPSGDGWGVRRTALQRLLSERAEEIGADLLWNTPVRSIDDDRVVCRNVTIRARWIVGADGLHSEVRRSAGLDRYLWNRERVAVRQHFAVASPPAHVQVLWAEAGQCYITPVGGNEISVAVITKRKGAEYRELLSCFPRLNESLAKAAATTSVRGSLTASRRLRRVFKGRVVLVGDASGSVDAITGEGICIGLRQAEAVAESLAAGELASYGRKQAAIMRRPALMAAVLSVMSSHHKLRGRVLSGLAQDPQLFERMLGFHVGTARLRSLGVIAPLRLGSSLLRLD